MCLCVPYVCAYDHKRAASYACGLHHTYLDSHTHVCARVCVHECVCVHQHESAYTAWPHGGQHAQVWDLTTRARSEGSMQRKFLGPKQVLPSPLRCPRPSPQHTLPPGSRQDGEVLTRDCRMAWLVAFMQESSGKEHSPSQ